MAGDPADLALSGPEVVADEGATLTERDGYEHGVPCWVDAWQEDPDTAATFYAGVFGWEVEKVTPPGTDTRYYMCRLRGSDVAAIGSPPHAGMPPAWATYVWVDDADAVAASAVKAGGRPRGRALREPRRRADGDRRRSAGAVFGVWTPGAIAARSASTSPAPTR